MKELISRDDLYDQNTIGIKLEKQKKVFKTDILFHTVTKEILRTKYLKLCWACGSHYESYKYNTYACSSICKQNITYRLKKGLKPLARMKELSKEKNIKHIKDRFGYN